MRFFILILAFIFAQSAIAQETSQKYAIKGVIKDSETGEALIGASVLVKAGVGGIADLDGNFNVKVEPGVYDVTFSYVGYSNQKMKIKVKDKDVFVSIKLESVTLDEVEIVANIGTVRETPVAITNVSQTKIQEELAGRDLPMILNSTPGVYATEQGGGSGDSRVTLRGFDQVNIAVLVDGVPVNDMENGAVYWSNWDGLSEITRTMQVQRGLGATKLAVSSVGGTINIITQGIDQKMQTTIKRDYGNNNYQRTSLAFNSGLINNKFGFVFAGSYRSGDGWVDNTWIEAYSYFAKFQWKINSRHLLSLSANGAPQKHGQKFRQMPIAVFDTNFAKKAGVVDISQNLATSGVTNSTIGPRGLRYNPDGGYLNGEFFNSATNFYHKPLINLSHFWTAAERITVSTVAYASFGNGGGSGFQNTVSVDPTKGYINLQNIYDANANFVASGSTLTNYGPEKRSTNIVRASMNNHRWYGFLTTVIFKLDSAFTLTTGMDGRYYRGLHYRKVYDLFGGDYFLNTSNKNQPLGLYTGSPYFKDGMKREGDKFWYNFDGLVTWGGLFSQLEYKKKQWSAFATATGSFTGYQRRDYFAKKDVLPSGDKTKWEKFMSFFGKDQIEDEIHSVIGWGDTLLRNNDGTYFVYDNNDIVYYSGDTTFVIDKAGSVIKDTLAFINPEMYTVDSEKTRYSKTRKQWFPGFTLKGGVNYKINEHYNVYTNFGVLSVAPKFNNVYIGNSVAANSNEEYNNPSSNQRIISSEVGAGAKYRKFAVNFNAYYTIWKNKPISPRTGLDGEVYNVNGLDALHMGIELDGTYKILKNLEWETAISQADWIYTTDKKIQVYDDAGNLQIEEEFFANGVHVGNAAQFQFSNSLKYEPIKGLYIKPRYTFFAKNYANFDPLGLQSTNANRESWYMPDYGLLDFNFGYELKYEGLKLNIGGSVSNILNTLYITDAQNNGNGSNQFFDANSATVFMGQGRRYVVGVRVTF